MNDTPVRRSGTKAFHKGRFGSLFLVGLCCLTVESFPLDWRAIATFARTFELVCLQEPEGIALYLQCDIELEAFCYKLDILISDTTAG